MVGITHPMIEIKSQSSSDDIFRYTLDVSELSERRAKRKAKIFLARMWGLRQSLGNIKINSVKRTDRQPSSRVDIMVKGPLSVYEIEATVDTRG
jgi:predicted nucleotidyltransferase